MAHVSDLPCDGDGICMSCKKEPSSEETLTCKTCAATWHVTCLSCRLQTLADALRWECPDCSITEPAMAAVAGGSGGLVAAIRAIESDESLTESQKAERRQVLVSGGARSNVWEDANHEEMEINGDDDVLNILHGKLNCSFCMQLPERPVTTPCGHNFCLRCFQKWIGRGKRTCANCRNVIPSKMATQPRINSALVFAIRMAQMSKSDAAGGPPNIYHCVHHQSRPDKAYTTKRAKKAGKANACSGTIFVTVPPDHFGPILAENDPVRKRGVLVGESWEDRLECRQWGVHLPHMAGIAGQSDYSAQSVAISGGYEDDEDHGEWFLYTGSGGRDLSGNKRTNKTHSFDQKFENFNKALQVSCQKGYPVRIVRSHKKHSSYAPERGVRYDGIYRIEKCWRKNGKQGYKVCRYLFVRCDNDPAPWTSDNCGDRPRPLPVIKELKNAIDITERKGSPFWDYDEDKACWLWKKPPHSRKQVDRGNLENGKRVRKVKRLAQDVSVRQKFLEELSCLICQKVMSLPLTTPCGHNFCQACLEGAFAGQSFIRQRKYEGWRTLRVQKNVMRCPSCSNDIADFLQNAQVNRELMGVIELLQQRSAEMPENSDESREETDSTNEETVSTNEESDASADEMEIHNLHDQMPHKVKDKALKMQPVSKPLLTYKRKKADGWHSNSNNAGQTDVEFVPVKPETVDAKEMQKVPVDNKFKQTYKRKKYKNRGNQSMQKEAVDNKFKQTYKRKMYKNGCNLPTLGTNDEQKS